MLVELFQIFLSVSVVRFPRYRERFESGDLSHFHEEGLGSGEADNRVSEHSIDEVVFVSRFKNLRTRIALFLHVTDVDEKIKSELGVSGWKDSFDSTGYLEELTGVPLVFLRLIDNLLSY